MSNQFLSTFQFVGSSIKAVKIKNDFISLDNGGNIKKKIDVSHSIASVESINDATTLSGILLLNIPSIGFW